MTGTGRSLTLLLAAGESAGLQVLKALAGSRHRIVGVLAAPEESAGGGVSVWQAAIRLGLPVWPADRVRQADLADTIRAEGVDVMLNVHSLHIVHPAVLGAPRHGAFNLHPGPLPDYAGLDTPSWALYQGEARYGVTVHRMAERVDTGAIIYREEFPIAADDTALTLYARCIRVGVALVLKLVETLAEDPGMLPHHAMDLSRRRYYGRKVPNGGWMAWDRPAAGVVNFVRACDFHPFPSPWGTPRTRLRDRTIGIAKARRAGEVITLPPGTVGRVDDRGAWIACADEAVLVTHLVADGRHVRAGAVLAPGDILFKPD